jgi:hypothetical protein
MIVLVASIADTSGHWSYRILGPKWSERKHSLSTVQFPVSAYVGSSKNLKDLKNANISQEILAAGGDEGGGHAGLFWG